MVDATVIFMLGFLAGNAHFATMISPSSRSG